jgi:signal transduction histidine kinase
MGPPEPRDALAFLTGGGEMGALMRAHDWAGTSLRPAELWPQSLRSALSICLGSSFQIAIYWGAELSLLYNDAWRPILGTKHPYALGRAGREVWPEIWDTIGPMFAHVFATGEATRSQDQLLAMHRHGFTEECYFDYTFSPIRDEAGKIGGIFNAVVETTFRVIGERRTRLLRDLGERIANAQSTQEASAAAVSALQSGGVDLPFSLIYLLDPASAEGTMLLAGVAGIEAGAAPAPLEMPLGGPCAWPVEEAFARAGAITVSDLSRSFGVKIAAGPWPEPCDSAVVVPLRLTGSLEVAGALIVGISPRLSLDSEYSTFIERIAAAISGAISRSRALQDERQRAAALAEIDRAKTTFFSNVSHELRTPLTLLMGPLADVLQDTAERLDSDTRRMLQVAHRNSARLLKLVNALLDFSRIEAGRVEAHYEAVDIAALTCDITSNFRSAIDRAGLRLQIECPPVQAPVYLDRHMWEMIVLNLLSNALKFTLEGEIRVSLRDHDGHVEFAVADTGTGIPASELPRLFERFYRVPNARGRTHEGSGIGLALVQELVRFNGGTIAVRSRLDEGTTFTISIPTGRAHLPAELIAATRSSPSASNATSAFVAEAERWVPDVDDVQLGDSALLISSPAWMRGGEGTQVESQGTIVLADDNADMREYVCGLLSRRFSVRTACDGEEALEMIRRNPPDLVLTDVMMPRLDGFGLLRAIRAHELTRELPVILLSARAGEESKIAGLEASADDYLVKPFSARELVARVSAQITVSKIRRQTRTELREADRRKDEFLATLAHELRNPLAPIRQATRIASMPGVSEAQLRWSNDIIRRQTQHMAMLLDDLLDVSRITLGKLELRKAPIELAAVIDTAVETARPLIDSRRHTLTVEVPKRTVSVVMDSLRVSQVIANLLTNAAKYTDTGGRISLRAYQQNGELVISVGDTGLGIAPEKLSTVFEMFSQIKSPIDRSEGGLGIGLALVRGLVQLHGGTVVAHSAGLGQGSEFTIRLPVADSAGYATTESAMLAGPAVENRRKVLIVDDNRDGAESLAMLLSVDGHEVRFACDAEQGLALAESFNPEVALLDIGLPKLNGYELAKRLRKSRSAATLKLVAITGWGQADDKRRAAAAGFDHHLTKPVDFDTMRAILAEGHQGAGD